MVHIDSFFRDYKKNLVSGIIVFLIALPLCLGVAQASGAPPFSGIVAGIVGGIVVGALSGSRLSVTGPAAGLTAIVLVAIADLGRFEIFLCAVMVAGALQLILGWIRAGGISHFIPLPVIEGMLAGIGLTIILKLIPDALGYTGSTEGGMLATIGQALNQPHVLALGISLLGLGLLFLWDHPVWSRWRRLPVGLLVVLIAVAAQLLWPESWGGKLGAEQRVQLLIPDSVGAFFTQFLRPDFSGFLRWEVWQVGLVIAVVASIESLLCLEATDKMDPQRRSSSPNRELKAQGVGNLVSGLLGGLPLTSVIVRSSANIQAGASSRLSAMFHGLLLLVCVALLPALLNLIPKAALAAILIHTGYKLCQPRKFLLLWKHGLWNPFLPFVVTALGVVALDLLTGVAMGIGVSILYTLWEDMRIPYSYERIRTRETDLVRITLAEEVSFLNKASIKKTLHAIPRGSRVILDGSRCGHLDYDVRQTITEFHQSTARERDIRLHLVGFRNIYQLPVTEPLEEDPPPEAAGDSAEAPALVQKSAGRHRRLMQQLNRELSV